MHLFFCQILVAVSFAVPIGDRVAYYVTKFNDQVSIKIEKTPPSSSDWVIEETFWAFDKPMDHCIPITVYSHPNTNGHSITQYGDENILFWFFAYDSTNHPILQHITPTKYDVYEDNLTLHIWKSRDINDTVLSIHNALLLSFYAFEYDDKYLQNISIHNCKHCDLVPPFEKETYSYYLIVPDDVNNVYFTTTPSHNVTIIYDDASHLLTEQEALENKVNKIVSFNVGSFKDPNSMNRNEIETMMLSFYNKHQINNNTINEYMNTSFYEWISEFVQDDTTHGLIERTYKHLSQQIESAPVGDKRNNGRDTLDSDGLLYEPWTPITVDIHYDLHHYRIFVIRKAGESDLKEFRKSMELNRNAYIEVSRKCPDISLDAIIHTNIPKWWDTIRVWVVSLSVFVVMAIYICYDRYSYLRLVQTHQVMNEAKGG